MIPVIQVIFFIIVGGIAGFGLGLRKGEVQAQPVRDAYSTAIEQLNATRAIIKTLRDQLRGLEPPVEPAA